ncbi:MAG: hypothetical protein FJZ95_08045, partial [Chloroflexi bacterium]|nr:hypothetical protein [Chloroflexota bacterium]
MEKRLTFCRVCEAGCGFVAEVENNRIRKYSPDKDHPLSRGYSCIKGREMANIQSHPRRLRFPLKKANGGFERISWAQAIDEIGSRLSEIKAKHGPHAIGAYMGNVLAFSYSAVVYSGALMNFIGTRNLYGAGSQDCNNKFAHSLRFYGSPVTIISPDFDTIDYFIVMGSNPLASHFTLANFPNPLGHLKAMQKRGCKIVWINPRRIESAKVAGEHFFIRPNADIYLVLAMIRCVLENGLEDREFIAAHSKGIEKLRAVIRESGVDLGKAEEMTGIAGRDIERITREFVEASKKGGASLYGRVGKDRGPFATLLAWAIDVFNFITGNVDRQGNFYSPGFFNVARLQEMGSEGPPPPGPRSRIGNLPSIMGYMPAATMADEILTPGEGQIRAMMVMGGDPLVSCPNTRKIERAFRELELLVSIDIFMNDTGSVSDYILPTTTFLEREEFSFFMSAFNRASFVPYSRAVVKPEGEVKDEWEIFNLLSEKIGVPTLGNQPLELLKMFFPGENQAKLAEMLSSERGIFLNDDRRVRFNTLFSQGIRFPDKRIPLVPEDYLPEFERLKRWQVPHDAEYPLSLISGRQVETINSWIHAHGKTNYCHMNPEDAGGMRVKDGDVVRVSSRVGTITIPVKFTEDMMRGVVWIPHG